MIATILLVIALVIGVAAVMLSQTDPGYVLLSYGHWIAETTMVVLVLGLALWCMFIYGLARLIVGLLHLPIDVRHALAQRRESRGLASFEAGLLHLLEGRWTRAEIELLRHAADRQSAHLNYLAAARAAQRLGAADRRDHYLALATESAGSSQLRVATLVTRAELQRERGEYDAVKATALELRAADHSSTYAIELQADALVALRQWSALNELLHDDAAGALEPVLRTRLQRQVASALLRQAVADGSLDHLKNQWKEVGTLQSDAELQLLYAQGLHRMGASAEALAVATTVLDERWDSGFARLCTQMQDKDSLALLASLERWLQRYGDRPELLTAAGRSCLENRLWGKAKSYLEAVVRVAPSPEAYNDLARLADQTQRPEDAAQYRREGLELAVQTGEPAQL